MLSEVNQPLDKRGGDNLKIFQQSDMETQLKVLILQEIRNTFSRLSEHDGELAKKAEEGTLLIDDFEALRTGDKAIDELQV